VSKFNLLSLLTLSVVTLAGCDSSSTSSENSKPAGPDAHNHGHSHANEGPHGGHILGLGNEEYHLEWLHNESGKLTFYLLDATAKEDVSTTAKSISIETVVKDETTTVAVNSTTPDAESHNRFEVIDPVLLQRLELVGHGVTAKATVSIEDKEYTGEFEHHDHGHGHSH